MYNINDNTNYELLIDNILYDIDILCNNIEDLENNNKQIVRYEDFQIKLLYLYIPYIYFLINYGNIISIKIPLHI